MIMLKMFLRLFKVVFQLCLLPFVIVSLTLCCLVVLPVVMIVDIPLYVLTGRSNLASDFIDRHFDNISIGWFVIISEKYDKLFHLK